MYIRRKVFSVLIDEDGEERYFSTTEFVNEDAYMERLFSKKDEEEEKKPRLSKKAKIAIAAGAGAAALGAAGYFGGKKLKGMYDLRKEKKARGTFDDLVNAEKARFAGKKHAGSAKAKRILEDLNDEREKLHNFDRGNTYAE